MKDDALLAAILRRWLLIDDMDRFWMLEGGELTLDGHVRLSPEELDAVKAYKQEAE